MWCPASPPASPERLATPRLSESIKGKAPTNYIACVLAPPLATIYSPTPSPYNNTYTMFACALAPPLAMRPTPSPYKNIYTICLLVPYP